MNKNTSFDILVQDNQSEIVKARLKLFGNPLACMLPDIKDGFQIKNPQKYYINFTTDQLLEINKSSPYGVFFTPNGDYGRLNVVGQQVTHKSQDSSGMIYSLFWDLDQKISPTYKNKTKEEYLSYIVNQIEDLDIDIQFIMQSGGGFHIYSFINYDDVSAVSEIIGDDLDTILKEGCNNFEGADVKCIGKSRLLRCPLSVHWKSGVPTVTKLYEVQRGEYQNGIRKVKLVEVTDEKQISLNGKRKLGPKEAETLLSNLKHLKQKDTPTYKKLDKNPIKYQINNIPYPILFDALQDYPRVLDGHIIKYSLNGTSVVIETDGIKYKTGGYKWWERENVLKNFSTEHTPTERPNGHILKFLEQYFDYDYGALAKFMKDKFEIEMFVEGGESISKLSMDKTTIIFKDGGVFIMSPTTQSEVMLFSTPFIIKGVIFTPVVIDGKSVQEMKIVINKLNSFEDEELEGGQEITLDLESKVSKFNDHYLKYGLSCCGTDKQLLAFYNVVRANVRNGTVIKFDGRRHNGYYSDCFVLGNKVFSKNGLEINPEDYNMVLNTPDLSMCRDGIDCTVGEFGNVLVQLFGQREGLLSLCTFIAASMGHDFWKPRLLDNGLPFILPHLFLTGKTKTGKSTLINLMKNGLGLTEQANKRGVTNTTPYALKVLSATPRWLHLEEFTGDVLNKTENIVRLGINGTDGGMGHVDGTSETLQFKCSYIIDGERMPSSPSLMNRFVGIITRKEDMKGDIKTLRWCSQIRFLKDFVTKLYSIDMTTVGAEFEKAQDFLLENGVQDRDTIIYSYLVCVAKWFDICEKNILLTSILENIKMLALGGTEVSPLGDLLAQRFSIHPLPKITQITDGDDNRYMVIPMKEDFYNSMKGNIATSISKFGKKRIQISGYNITLVINNTDTSKVNEEFLLIVRPYIPQCQMTYEDVGNDTIGNND